MFAWQVFYFTVMPRALTVGSLFAGIGGFDLGFERAGMEIKFQVEIDPFCRAVLAKHWPNVRRYEDVRQVHAADACGDRAVCDRCLEPVDVLCGGFPCQDISVAGRGEGIDGARSGLWSEFDRLIGELRPAFVIVENVSALLSRGLGRVLGDLAARGYDAEWDCLPASAFGAPHQRDRLWLVAYAESTEWWPVAAGRNDANGNHAGRQEATSRSESGGEALAHTTSERGQQAAQRSESGQPMPELGCSCLSDSDRSGRLKQWRAFPIRAKLASAECRDWWLAEPDVGRVAHGISNRVDRLRGLGNAVVPQITQWIGERLMESVR